MSEISQGTNEDLTNKEQDSDRQKWMVIFSEHDERSSVDLNDIYRVEDNASLTKEPVYDKGSVMYEGKALLGKYRVVVEADTEVEARQKATDVYLSKKPVQDQN